MIEQAVTTWLYRLILESPPAHTLLLQLYLGSEAFHKRFPWFNRPDLVEDPALRLLMKQHFADEDNHAKYFELALTLRGHRVAPPPTHLDYLVNLAGAFWDAGLLLGDTVEELQGPGLFTNRQNLFVQLAFKDLSEKRAIGEFHVWRDLAKTREPEVYAILKRVVEDEDWHVHIFDDQVHRMLHETPSLWPVYARLKFEADRIRRLNSSAFLDHILDHGLLTAASPADRLAIRALAGVQRVAAGALPEASAARIMAMQGDYYTARAAA